MDVLLTLVLATLAARPLPGGPVPLEDPGHAGLSRWYGALRSAAAGEGVARAIQYGDSTIAVDGLTRTVRARLVERFGDAGPGFVTAAFDPRWNERSDLVAHRAGAWSLRTILFGGAGGRYGLGGIVGIARGGASVTLSAADPSGAVVPQRHLEVWYQAGVGYGTFVARLDDLEVAREPAVAAATEDRRFVLDRPEGFTTLRLAAEGGPVPYYGVVLETGRPGATWEALGVIGVGSRSFTTYAAEHLPSQVAARDPDLLVVMIGGNEAGFPVLNVGKGEGYAPIFRGAIEVIRAGAPGASCLVVTPLDQGFVDEVGVSRSKPGMANLVAVQREVALAEGCAFWSAWQAMGGRGAAVTWANHGGLATGDLVHLSGRGLELIGDRMADALLAGFEAWEGARADPAPLTAPNPPTRTPAGAG